MLYRFVNQSGGIARVSGAPERNTPVSHYLPLAIELLLAVPVKAESMTLSSQTGVVVVVGDEEHLVEVLDPCAEEMIFKTLKAGHAAADLAMFNEQEFSRGQGFRRSESRHPNCPLLRVSL